MILLLLIPLRRETFDLESVVESLSATDALVRGVAAIVCGAAYYFSRLREYFLADAYHRIRENIKTRLLAACLGDPQVAAAADRLRERRRLLDGVFYHFIDADRSLTEKAQRVRFNGLIWSSAGDLSAISTFGVFLYWGAAILYEPRPHFIWIAAILFAIERIATQLLVPRLTGRHLDLQNEQLDYMTTILRYQLCARLKQLASAEG